MHFNKFIAFVNMPIWVDIYKSMIIIYFRTNTIKTKKKAVVGIALLYSRLQLGHRNE